MTRLRLLFLTMFVIAVAGCGNSTNLPPAAGILKDSSTATAAVTRTHLKLTVNGDPPGVRVRSVDGDVDKSGDAKGSIKVNYTGALIEGDFVIVGGQAFFKGPTGTFAEYTIERTKKLYDTTVILDPDRGLAHLLAVATDAKTESEDEIDGVKAYKISAKLTKDQVKPMVPGIREDLDTVFWIPVDGPKHLLRVWFSIPDADPSKPTVEATMSDFDKPFSVAKPDTSAKAQ